MSISIIREFIFYFLYLTISVGVPFLGWKYLFKILFNI